MADLFENIEPPRLSRESVAAGAVLLRGNALAFEDALLEALGKVAAQAPFRHMVTPGGFSMSVAMTNCGAVGWVTDRTGYRYDRVDPESGRPWPALPEVFCMVATTAGAEGWLPGFRARCLPDQLLRTRCADVVASGQK